MLTCQVRARILCKSTTEHMTMTVLAAISWGLAVALFVGLINLCIIAELRGRPDE